MAADPGYNAPMTRILIMCLAAAFALLAGSGCVVVTDNDLLFYEPGCVDSLDCEVGSTCFDVSYDNGSYIGYDTMCTDYCAFDSDCPGLGICESIDGSSVICWDTCTYSSDCYAGWGCWMLTTGDWTCLPE